MNPERHPSEPFTLELESADPLHCVVELLVGAARVTRAAMQHLERGDFEQAHQAFAKAQTIVLHFLTHIPESDESELATNLRSLFQFAYSQLVEGDLRGDAQCAAVALQIICTLSEGWSALEQDRRAALGETGE
jgi:flagellar biosynthetic protein FliS